MNDETRWLYGKFSLSCILLFVVKSNCLIILFSQKKVDV